MVLVALSFSVTLLAQKGGKSAVVKTDNGNKEVTFYKQLYKNAMKYNDLETAILATSSILAQFPEMESHKDTLALLYFNSGRMVQAALVSQEIVDKNPQNKSILEVLATSQQSLGVLKESLANFEKLYALSNDIYHQYQIASIQFSMERYGECGNTVSALLARETENTKEITITAANGQAQKVSIKAASYNMLGVMALQMNQLDIAEKSFKEAITLEPQFLLANYNMQRVQQGKEEAAGEKKAK